MYQRKLALKNLLESAGFKILLDDLKLFQDGCDLRVINRSKKAIGIAGLSRLNFDLGEKAGLDKVLNIIKGYEQDLIDKSSDPT